MDLVLNKMLSNPKITVVLHGGLGNQLFQLFRSLLILIEHSNAKIEFIEFFLDKYATKRKFELGPYLGSHIQYERKINPNLYIKLRIAKILNSISPKKEKIYTFHHNEFIVDGYFQSINDYESIPFNTIKNSLKLIKRSVTGHLVLIKYKKKEIYHIRLSDFFKKKEDAENYINMILNNICQDIDLITDDEKTLKNAIYKKKLRYKVNLISTKNYSSWKVIQIMFKYQKIFSNGSTLAFWAAILSESNLEISNQKLQDLFNLLTSAQKDVNIFEKIY